MTFLFTQSRVQFCVFGRFGWACIGRFPSIDFGSSSGLEYRLSRCGGVFCWWSCRSVQLRLPVDAPLRRRLVTAGVKTPAVLAEDRLPPWQPALVGSVDCWPMVINYSSQFGGRPGSITASGRDWRRVSSSWGVDVAGSRNPLGWKLPCGGPLFGELSGGTWMAAGALPRQRGNLYGWVLRRPNFLSILAFWAYRRGRSILREP